jgi:hypothetical protein
MQRRTSVFAQTASRLMNMRVLYFEADGTIAGANLSSLRHDDLKSLHSFFVSSLICRRRQFLRKLPGKPARNYKKFL